MFDEFIDNRYPTINHLFAIDIKKVIFGYLNDDEIFILSRAQKVWVDFKPLLLGPKKYPSNRAKFLALNIYTKSYTRSLIKYSFVVDKSYTRSFNKTIENELLNYFCRYRSLQEILTLQDCAQGCLANKDIRVILKYVDSKQDEISSHDDTLLKKYLFQHAKNKEVIDYLLDNEIITLSSYERNNNWPYHRQLLDRLFSYYNLKTG